MTRKEKKEIGKARLAALAALLKIVPEEKFNMCVYLGKMRTNSVEPKPFPVTDYRVSLDSCGTVACAMGHAISAFPQLAYLPDTDSRGCVRLVENNGTESYFYDELDAGASFFQITRRQAKFLFLPADVDKVSKETVIARIEAMANR